MTYRPYNALSLLGSVLASSAAIYMASTARSLEIIEAVGEEAMQFAMTDAQFESWLTQGSDTVRNRTRSQLRSALAAVDLACHLSTEQREKLELAGQGDIQRFRDQVDALRLEVVGKSYGQDEIGEVYQRVQPLNRRLQNGLFGSSSLFAKVLPRTLDAPQRALWETLQREQNARRYKARVHLYVLSLQHALALTESQRNELVAALLKWTSPPKTYGDFDWHYVAWQASQIPIERLGVSLDDAQRKVLEAAMSQGEQWGGWLHHQRVIAEGD